MTGAIVIDKWKLPVFTRHLRNGGFNYEESGGLTKGTLLLKVEYTADRQQALAQLCLAANTEAAKEKK